MQNSGSYSPNLMLPLARSPELAAQHSVTRSQKQAGIGLTLGVEALPGMGILIQHEVRVVAPGMPVVVDKKNSASRTSNGLLIIRAKMIPVYYNPIRVGRVRHPNGYARILFASWLRFNPLYLDGLVLQPPNEGRRGLRHSKYRTPSRILPGLGQRQTSHHMPRPNSDVRVCTN